MVGVATRPQAPLGSEELLDSEPSLRRMARMRSGEFGKELTRQLREHVEKQEGAEGKRRLELLQMKAKQAHEHTPQLAKEARGLRMRLEARVAHVEL